MSLFERFWPDARARAREGKRGDDVAEQKAMQLIDEGNVCEDEGRFADARQRYEAAIRLAPHLARAHLNLGNIRMLMGDLEGAKDAYKEALALNPDYAAAHYNLGNAYARSGRGETAVAAYHKALALKPDFADAAVALGCVLEDLGQLDAAVAGYRRAVEINRDHAEAHSNLANVLKDLGQFEDAKASYRRVLEIKPDFVDAHYNLGVVLQHLGQLDEAKGAIGGHWRSSLISSTHNTTWALSCNSWDNLPAHKRATSGCWRSSLISSTRITTWVLSCNTLDNLTMPRRAISGHWRSSLISSTRITTWVLSCNTLDNLTTHKGAIGGHWRSSLILSTRITTWALSCNSWDNLTAHKRATSGRWRSSPTLPLRAAIWAMCSGRLANLMTPRRAIAVCYASILTMTSAHSNLGVVLQAYSGLLFCLSHRDEIGSEALFAEHCRFGEQFETPLRPSWPEHGNTRDPTRCLQIGFVSADLRSHPVGFFVEPLLARLAMHSTLSLHAYYNHAVEDVATKRLRGHFSQWHAIAHLSDAALAQKIADDGIDILIDLSGHTGANRLLCFARKPAPVQASWIGYPGTTGLRAMDYYLADRYFLPPGVFDSQFTEKLVYLPASAPFLPDETAPPVNALPALSNGFVTFGSFSRISKLSRSAIALWSRLLRALPDARMLLGGMPREGEYDSLIDWFVQEGIARERLRFHSALQHGRLFGAASPGRYVSGYLSVYGVHHDQPCAVDGGTDADTRRPDCTGPPGCGSTGSRRTGGICGNGRCRFPGEGLALG